MREKFWEVLTKTFPQTSEKLVECKIGCWGDGSCAARKFNLRGKLLVCLMKDGDLENIDLVKQSVDTDVVGGNVL